MFDCIMNYYCLKMNKILLLSFLFLCMTIGVKADGLSFFKGKYDKALQEAKVSGKPVLLYFRVKGTEPCGYFEKEVLANDTVGEVYNARFVNVLVEADKKNQELLSAYGVREAPLVIWLNAEGKEVYRMVGDIPVSVMEHAGQVMLGKKPSLEDLLAAVKKSDYSLEAMQTMLSEGLAFLPILGEKAINYWTGEIKAVYQRYLDDKSFEEMVNEKDFRILTCYEDEAKLYDPVFEFILENYDAFKEIVPEKDVADYLINRNLEVIGRLTYAGNEAYTEAVERIGGDLSKAYALMESVVGMDTVIRYQADADFWLHGKKDLDAYVDVKNEYFKVLGGKLKWQDLYSAVNDLKKAAQGKFTEKALEVCLAWVDVVDAQKDIEPSVRLWAQMTKGDCLQGAGDLSNAKACYNQAYMIAMQLKNQEVQEFLKQKIAALEQAANH